MRIDAHQHFWSVARGDYGWLTPDLGPLYRDYLPRDLEPALRASGIDGTVLVQAAPTVAETEYMLALAGATPFVFGVVGWVDFEAADAPGQIARLAEHPALVGLRPMIQDIDDPDWMLKDALTPAFEAVARHDLTFDALTLPQHLPRLRRLLERHPALRCVVDHGSKPRIKEGRIGPWAEDMRRLARDTSAFCKFSGLVTEAGPDWRTADLADVAQVLIDAFGPERLIWGSDWPVCLLASDYARWVGATDELLGALKSAERDAVFGGNAALAYRLRLGPDIAVSPTGGHS